MKAILNGMLNLIMAVILGFTLSGILIAIYPDMDVFSAFLFSFLGWLIVFSVFFLALGKLKKGYTILSLSVCLGVYGVLFISGLNYNALPVFQNATTNRMLFIFGAFLFLGALFLKLYLKNAKLSKPASQASSVPPPTVVTSRDTDKALKVKTEASLRPPAEKFVRDPWGNLIPESEYNKKIEDAKNKRL